MFRAVERMVMTFGLLGEQGWELVSIYDKGSNWMTSMEKGFALFKRAVPEGERPIGPWAEAIRASDFSAVSPNEALLQEIEDLEAEQLDLDADSNPDAARRVDEISDRLVELNVQLAAIQRGQLA